MSEKAFVCKILTPERTVLDIPVEKVIVPAYDGEMGILLGHTNLVAQLGAGECRIHTKEGMKRYYLEGGVVKVASTREKTQVVILGEKSLAEEELLSRKEELDKEWQELCEKRRFASEEDFTQYLQRRRSVQAKRRFVQRLEKVQ